MSDEEKAMMEDWESMAEEGEESAGDGEAVPDFDADHSGGGVQYYFLNDHAGEGQGARYRDLKNHGC